MPTGDNLLSGYYLNELLLRLLARDDPHPALFDVYAATVRVLASEDDPHAAAGLRAFELLLLREIGLLPVLDMQTATLAPLDPRSATACGRGRPGRVGRGDTARQPERRAVAGAAGRAGRPRALPRHLARSRRRAELKTAAARLLHYHCGVHTLRTRQLMMDLQAL
jgi:DNA repair protein RecO (recombination protein O)